MKLLHITATHLSLAGGIPVVLRDLVEAQNNIEDFEARVLSVKASTSEMKSTFFDTLSETSFEEYINRYLPDVVIFHSHYYFEYLNLYKLLLKKNIPYFIEPHGSFGKAALQKSKYKKLIANKVILRMFMRRAKGYIFLNESEKKDAQFHTNNDIIIPNGIVEREIKPLCADNKECSFYFIGRYDINHKGLDYLFDALDILENKGVSIIFNLYGKGNESEEQYINSRISKYKAVQIKNCGAIYGEAQSKELEQCGIMVLTSRYEGFPMTVLEAWKYGNPCLVTPGTNVYKEVASNGLGWAVELSVQHIADMIVKAQNDYNLNKKQYIIACKNYVKNNYSWKSLAKLSFDALSIIVN